MIAMLAFFVFMQIQQPVPVPVQPRPPAPGPSAQQQTVMTAAELAVLMYDSDSARATRFAGGGFAMLDTIWNLPDFLRLNRDPSHVVDDPGAAVLNDTMLRLLPGLVVVGFVLVIGQNALSVLTGREPNPLMVFGALTIVALAALAAEHNRYLQRLPVDLVNLLLRTISGAPIREFAAPGLHVATFSDQFIAAIGAIVFVILLLGLTVILFIESAWCIVLGSQMGILILFSALPFVGGPSQALIRRWGASLFSPVIVVVALRLLQGIIMALPSGTPDFAEQFLLIAFAIVVWGAPGLIAGSMQASLPGMAQLYFAGRVLGLGRGGGASGGNNGGGGNPRVRQNPPSASGTRVR